ncbi:MAG: endonuclease V [Planctomycetota bacterium]|jgi:deoxyribonuclease V
MARSIKHRWDLAPKEAVRLQRELASKVVMVRPPWGGKLSGLVVAGADVSCPRGSRLLRAAVVALRLPGFDVLGAARIEREATFPYVPGLLSFREGEIVLDCFAKLRKELRRAQGIKIDCLMCDGQGLAHPRGLGLASHVGLWLGVPTVGCAKSRLCGEHDEPGPTRGDWAALTLKGKRVGRVLRTRDSVKPLYVSVGHLTTLAAAAKLVLACAPRYRLPEPTRLAHHAAGWRGAEGDLLPELRRIVRKADR